MGHLADYFRVLGCTCVRDLRLLEKSELEVVQLISRRRLLEQLDKINLHHEGEEKVRLVGALMISSQSPDQTNHLSVGAEGQATWASKGGPTQNKQFKRKGSDGTTHDGDGGLTWSVLSALFWEFLNRSSSSAR